MFLTTEHTRSGTIGPLKVALGGQYFTWDIELETCSMQNYFQKLGMERHDVEICKLVHRYEKCLERNTIMLRGENIRWRQSVWRYTHAQLAPQTPYPLPNFASAGLRRDKEEHFETGNLSAPIFSLLRGFKVRPHYAAWQNATICSLAAWQKLLCICRQFNRS